MQVERPAAVARVAKNDAGLRGVFPADRQATPVGGSDDRQTALVGREVDESLDTLVHPPPAPGKDSRRRSRYEQAAANGRRAGADQNRTRSASAELVAIATRRELGTLGFSDAYQFQPFTQFCEADVVG